MFFCPGAAPDRGCYKKRYEGLIQFCSDFEANRSQKALHTDMLESKLILKIFLKKIVFLPRAAQPLPKT